MSKNNALNHRSFGIIEQSSKEICRALGATGVMTSDDAKRKFGIAAFNELVEKKMIKSMNTIDGRDKIQTIHLTDKGKEYTRKHLTYGSLYTWNRMQLKHDLELNKIYLGLSKEERMTWQNESQLRLFSKGEIQGVDGSYTKNGKKIAVEIVTHNYPASKLSQKIEMINEHFDGVEIRSV
jgi:DNA-binding MarR family transcriptional regulator